jgi:hypothetical protein
MSSGSPVESVSRTMVVTFVLVLFPPLALARRNVIDINNMTSNMTVLEAAMRPELN